MVCCDECFAKIDECDCDLDENEEQEDDQEWIDVKSPFTKYSKEQGV